TAFDAPLLTSIDVAQIDFPGTLSLPSLTATYDFVVAKVTQVDISSLVTVNGMLGVGCPAPTMGPKLTTVIGQVYIGDISSMGPTFSLPALQSAGSFNIIDGGALRFPALTSVAGGVQVQILTTKATTLDMPALTSVAGAVEIVAENMTKLSMPALTTIPG